MAFHNVMNENRILSGHVVNTFLNMPQRMEWTMVVLRENFFGLHGLFFEK